MFSYSSLQILRNPLACAFGARTTSAPYCVCGRALKHALVRMSFGRTLKHCLLRAFLAKGLCLDRHLSWNLHHKCVEISHWCIRCSRESSLKPLRDACPRTFASESDLSRDLQTMRAHASRTFRKPVASKKRFFTE